MREQTRLSVVPPRLVLGNDDLMKAAQFTNYDKLVRPVSQTKAMAATTRWWNKMKRFVTCQRHQVDDTPSFQYRIPPRDEKRRGVAHWAMAGERMFASATRFFNERTFLSLILCFVVLYFVFIFVFAFIIQLVIVAYDDSGVLCVTVHDYVRGEFAGNFLRSFDLSWTTYSTVGYGVVSPPPEDTCLGLRYLLSIEAFVGILFSGFCGGMFFLKISRLHTRAYATFSSCMCLQFGSGVSDDVEIMHVTDRASVRRLSVVKKDNVRDRSKTTPTSVTPFPVLAFRLINSQAYIGGEIVDASITCMAVSVETSVDADDFEDSNRVAIDAEQVNNGVDCSSHSGERSTKVKKRVFCKLRVTPDVNPFFSNGVWYVRHELNHKSALLKSSVRQRVAEIASWPADIDTYSKIRDSMDDKVQEIVVRFNGISNLTADSVFKTVSYKQEDIFIGWQFASCHYLVDRNSSSALDVKIDADLLHDIVPQNKGGCEPLGRKTE